MTGAAKMATMIHRGAKLRFCPTSVESLKP
jgi:hypothetical protein